ncbi:DPP IV N-terminal domain-containing protein, partial [Gemmatimonas sp.]|uniref:DPP IV N-terminal domain-containing protein n=1 Tax=Gemmatimonas sp. TaxID=1962908 RepID=UPI00391E0185
MRRSVLLTAVAAATPWALLAPAAAQAQPRALTAADYARAEKFLGFNTQPLVSNTGVQPAWLPDGRFTYRVRQSDGTQPLLLVNAKGVKTNCATAGAACPPETPRATPRNRGNAPEVLSPDGSKAAFIRDWNLWVRDVATNQETALTTDGAPDYGYATDNAGWVHSNRAILLWSPDSKKIATFQQDQRKTGEMYLVRYKVGHPELLQWKYPLPGDSTITMIERVVVDLSGTAPKVVRFRMSPDQHRSSVCDHINCGGKLADTEWFPNGSMVAFLSNSRDHKVATLRVADANTGEVRDVLREEVATQFESGDGDQNWRVLPASNELIWFVAAGRE